MHYLNVTFAFIFAVDKDIIQIHNDKNIEFFHENLIDVGLEYCQSNGQSKKHYLIFEVAVSGLESSLPLIFFANFHPVIGTSEVKLGKPPCLPKSIQGLPNQRQWILVLDCEVIKFRIINAKLEAAIWLFIKKNESFCKGFGGSDKTIFKVGLDVSF